MVQPLKPATVRLIFSRWHHGEENDGEQRAFCPLCEDPETSATPSASINAEENKWYCQKGSHGGTIRGLVKELKATSDFNIRSERIAAVNRDPGYDASRRKSITDSANNRILPSEMDLKRQTDNLLKGGHFARLQSERGFSEQTVLDFKLGWDGLRYTFPIFDVDGNLVNVRRYKMGSNVGKMQNVKGCGTPARLYGIEDLAAYDTIVVTEGETDRVLLKQYLREARNDTIGVVTTTHGAGTFLAEWTRLFSGKRVYVCYDADDSGVNGAAKVVALLKLAASEIYTVVIPLSEKGSDITDYLHLEGNTLDDFLILMAESETLPTATVIAPPADREAPAQHGELMSLIESLANKNIAKTVELIVSVVGRADVPVRIPKAIEAHCDMAKGAVCGTCPIGFANGHKRIEISVNDSDLNEFVDIGLTGQMKVAKDRTGARCATNVEITIPEYQRCEQIIVQPSVDERSEDESQTDIRRIVWSVGTHDSGVNEKIRLVGINTGDATKNQDRFQAWLNHKVDADIDKFKLTTEIEDQLKIFSLDYKQSPLDKCIEIANDLADNITHIYERPLLHVGYDLVWHSVQSFNIHDVPIKKGWLEMMMVGDTRTGKSMVAQSLINHYRTGRFTSCEGSTFAGIVGGVQQINGSWTTTWGVVPMNDRRLVVLDEVSGAKTDMIAQMSSIRSEGVAELNKISRQETSARTRLIWITNPMSGGNIADDPDLGMAALRSVVPNNEDIARFDFVLAAARGEVDNNIINSTMPEVSAPEYGSQACENLVKWAWSLKRSDIRISERAIKAASNEAKKMKDEYINDPPLIQSEDVRFKILRIACALAARTFSQKNGKLLVDKIHVTDAVRFLNLIYGPDDKGRDAMGYRRKSGRVIHARKLAAESREPVKAMLLQRTDLLAGLIAFKGQIIYSKPFAESSNMTIESVQTALQELLMRKMISVRGNGFRMSETLISVLRELEDEDIQL